MRAKPRWKLGAAVTALALLCGCQFGSAAQTWDVPQRDGAGQMESDAPAAGVFEGMQTEYPRADTVVPLPGDPVEPAGTLMDTPDGIQDTLYAAAWGQTQASPLGDNEVRAVWFSYMDLKSMLDGKTQSQFQKSVSSAFANVSDYGLNTVIVHVRPYGDALYDSAYYPWSHVATGTQGKSPGYDPLKIMVEEAKKQGLRIEAWVNPYRVSPANAGFSLSADNPGRAWLEAGDAAVVEYKGVVSYNPASAKAQQLIVDGVREIARGYDVDGIHIDDYFYPTTDEEFDAADYGKYQKEGGALSLADWRRANVETLLKKMYTGIKEENPSVVFGISPQGNLSTNYNVQYLNVQKILSAKGYCDYIMPQIYYGFQNETMPFTGTAAAWNKLAEGSGVKLYFGLAAYKCGLEDAYAGTGKGEWKESSDMLQRMVAEARDCSNYGGFSVYRYGSLFAPENGVQSHIGKESKALKSVL